MAATHTALTLSIRTFPPHSLWLVLSGSHVGAREGAGHNDRFTRGETERAVERAGLGRYRTSNPRKSMWPVLVVFLEHGNDKIIG